MAKWVCTVCGYVYEGENPPAECPVCHVGADKFKKVEGDLTLAAEHEFGVYASTVKNNPEISDEDKKYIFEQLKANFEGECSEVGMYLCMARVAHREGYPEIGLYWEKAAYEEAEHAAKFAEMLGEDLEPNMKATTKDNLAWRVDCEFGATAGKTDLAKCAKKNNLDAIHDTVHEMARDEARHGRALRDFLTDILVNYKIDKYHLKMQRKNQFVKMSFYELVLFGSNSANLKLSVCFIFFITFIGSPSVIAGAIVADSKSVICQMYILQKRFGISTHSSNVESVLLLFHG